MKQLRQRRNSIKAIIADLLKADAFILLRNEKTGFHQVIKGRNIVTDAGDTWYAQSACGETPTNDFNSLYLATAGPAVGKGDNYSSFTVQAGSEKLVTATYPKSNDGDADNTGAGVDVVSWLFSYTTGDGPFATAITHSFVSIAAASGSNPILNSYQWPSTWTKDADTSAKIFANHTMNGV